MIWDKVNQPHLAASFTDPQEPDTHCVRFVMRNFRHVPLKDRRQIKFLDIGPGASGNSAFLERRGFSVFKIDFDPNVNADLHQDIRTVDTLAADSFDCVLDFNTLCHVENPPFRKIKEWLKPGGKFFSVTPRDDTWRGTLEGKGYCRCAPLHEICKLYEDFAPLIGWSAYTHDGHEITSWIVEGCK